MPQKYLIIHIFCVLSLIIKTKDWGGLLQNYTSGTFKEPTSTQIKISPLRGCVEGKKVYFRDFNDKCQLTISLNN